MTLTNQELATVLAALRYWQEMTQPQDRIYKDRWNHFTKGIDPLGDNEIDDLCESLNCDNDKLQLVHIDTTVESGGAETGDIFGVYETVEDAIDAVNMSGRKVEDDNVNFHQIKIGDPL